MEQLTKNKAVGSYQVAGHFFFNDTATTEIYTLSLHDALPICCVVSLMIRRTRGVLRWCPARSRAMEVARSPGSCRSEEHTSELQSQSNLVCRLLLEKKNTLPLTGQE